MARRSAAPVRSARRLIAYVRVSTSKQADEGVSLDAQRAKVAAYAALHDAELVRVCTDAGRSASTLADRPALADALAALRRGEADALLVVKLDRLTRSTRDLGELLDRATREGWAILSVAESLDTATAAGRLVVSVLGAVAQWEREAIGERTAAAMQHLRAEGRYTGGRVRYGFRVGNDGELVPHEGEQAVLAAVAELRAAGMSLRAVAGELAARGFLTREGRAFSVSAVHALAA